MALKHSRTTFTQTRSTGRASVKADSVYKDAVRRVSPWAALSSRPLTAEDIREIGENTTGLFALLREWDRAESCVPSDRPGSRMP